MTAHNPNIGARLVRLSVRAARRANHRAIQCRAAGDIAEYRAQREFALMNIGEAKNTASQLRRTRG